MTIHRIRHRWLGSAFALTLLAGCQPGDEGTAGRGLIASEPIAATARAEAKLTVGTCSSPSGAVIRLEGAITLEGLTARLLFTNNRNHFTHTAVRDVAAPLVVVPADQAIEIPRKTETGQLGNDPWVWVQFLDGDGQPVSDQLPLGRCSEGYSGITVPLSLAATAVVFDSTRSTCSNRGGAEIALDAALVFDGLTARLTFADEATPEGQPDPSETVASVDQVVIEPRATLAFPKQPVRGGVGGNPWIFLELLDAAGDSLGEPALLGRCVELERPGATDPPSQD